MIGLFGLDYNNDVVERPTGAFIPEEITSLEILDIAFIIFSVIFIQYLEFI